MYFNSNLAEIFDITSQYPQGAPSGPPNFKWYPVGSTKLVLNIKFILWERFVCTWVIPNGYGCDIKSVSEKCLQSIISRQIVSKLISTTVKLTEGGVWICFQNHDNYNDRDGDNDGNKDGDKDGDSDEDDNDDPS